MKSEMKTVRVTSWDIQNGIRRDPERCAVVLALIRTTGKRGWVVAHGTATRGLWRRQVIPLPERIINWTGDFDSFTKDVRPIDFMIEL